MYRIILVCAGVPKHAGEVAARGITEEFTHRPWHTNVKCIWDGLHLDEFCDAISANIEGGFDGDLKILSVSEIDS
jgi:hypothetical protein